MLGTQRARGGMLLCFWGAGEAGAPIFVGSTSGDAAASRVAPGRFLTRPKPQRHHLSGGEKKKNKTRGEIFGALNQSEASVVHLL